MQTDVADMTSGYIERMLSVDPAALPAALRERFEAKRLELDPATAERLICIHEYTRPGPNGPY